MSGKDANFDDEEFIPSDSDDVLDGDGDQDGQSIDDDDVLDFLDDHHTVDPPVWADDEGEDSQFENDSEQTHAYTKSAELEAMTDDDVVDDIDVAAEFFDDEDEDFATNEDEADVAPDSQSNEGTEIYTASMEDEVLSDEFDDDGDTDSISDVDDMVGSDASTGTERYSASMEQAALSDDGSLDSSRNLANDSAGTPTVIGAESGDDLEYTVSMGE